MSWSDKYKRSIDCDSPQGFSQKAHCAARKKRQKGEKTKSRSPFNEMHEIKSHKTVEQIAKKHRLEVSFIQKQLEMGVPIEHEHTKDKDLATDIALQHLDEIPDYYTRLKKMESDAKKHHKKFKDINVTEEGLRDWFGKSKSKGGKPGWVDVVDGDACAREEGETATPKCVSSAKRASMSKEERLAAQAAKRREDPNQPQKSGAAKPTMVQTDRKVRKEEMDLQEVKDKPGKGSGKKDACYHKVKSRYDVWPSAYASGALVKCRKVGAANWGTKSEAVEMIRYCPKCQKDESRNECKYGPKFWDMFSTPSTLSSNQMKYNVATVHPANEEKDHEYSMARSELSTIISAAKRLKKKMKGEGSIEAWVQSKITKAADYIDTAADYIESGEHNVGEACWDGYNKKGMKKKGNKIVPNCVKKEEYSNWREQLKEQIGVDASKTPEKTPEKLLQKLIPKYGGGTVVKSSIGMQKAHFEPKGELVEYSNWREDFQLSEDWQKVNRQDKTDGLSQKAVDAYRRENPGSKLQTAVTEKNPTGKRAKRRTNFCRRMKGMKSKLTSAKTARDPDSRINKALRRWNCN